MAEISRVPPQDLDAEQWMLGQVLTGEDVAQRAVDCLTEDCFYDPKHRLIFKAIRNLRVEQEPVDEIIVADRLKTSGDLEKVGGVVTLVQLSAGIMREHGNTHFDHYTKILVEKAQRRRLIEVGDRIAHQSYDESLSVAELGQGALDEFNRPLAYQDDHGAWRGTKFLNWSDEAPRWIVEPFIAPKDVMFLIADAHVGKTMLLCDMMLSVGLGRPWLGQYKTNFTPTLYIDFDGHGDGDMLRWYVRKVANGMGLGKPYEELEGRFEIVTHFHMPHGFNLYRGENLDTIKQQIKAGSFGLVIIDTFICVHGSDSENDAGKMGIVMNRLRGLAYETGAALVVAHHARKPTAGIEDSNGASYRGSTTIKAQVDCMVELRKQKGGIIRMSHPKMRHVKQLDDVPVSISDAPDGVVVRIEDEDKLASDAVSEAKAWLLWTFWPELPDQEERVRQVTILEAAEDLKKFGERTLRKALKELEDDGKVIKSKGGYRNTETMWRVCQTN